MLLVKCRTVLHFARNFHLMQGLRANSTILLYYAYSKGSMMNFVEEMSYNMCPNML